MIKLFSTVFIIIMISNIALADMPQEMHCYEWLKNKNVEENGWPLEKNTGCLQRPICNDTVPDDHICKHVSTIKCPEPVYPLYLKYHDNLRKAYEKFPVTGKLPNEFYLIKDLKQSKFGEALLDWLYLTLSSTFEIESTSHDGKKKLEKGVDAYEYARYKEFFNACPIRTHDFQYHLEQPGLKTYFNVVYRPSSKPRMQQSLSLANNIRLGNIRSSARTNVICRQFPAACNLLKQLVNAALRHGNIEYGELNDITAQLLLAIRNGYTTKHEQVINKELRAFDNKLKLRENQRLALKLKILELFGQQQDEYQWADFNNDNQADFAVKNGYSIEIYLASNNNSYRQSARLDLDDRNFSIETKDFDRDNKLDIIARSNSNQVNDIYFKGRGNGTFQKMSVNPCQDQNLNGMPDCDENLCTKSGCFSGGLSGYLGPNIGANVNVSNADTGNRYNVANQLQAFYIELNNNQATADALLFATTVPKSRTHDVYSPNRRLSGTQNGSDWHLSMFAKQPTAASSYLMTISLADPPSDRKNPASKYKVQVVFGMDRALDYRNNFIINTKQKILCLVKRNSVANSFLWGVSCHVN